MLSKETCLLVAGKACGIHDLTRIPHKKSSVPHSATEKVSESVYSNAARGLLNMVGIRSKTKNDG